MKLLKKIWDKCGEENFSLQVILIFTTLCTLYCVTSLDNPPLLNAIIILLNIIFGVAYYFFGDD